MLPCVLAHQLKQGLIDYLETTFPMTNQPFMGMLRHVMETPGAIFHEPFVRIQMPFRSAEQPSKHFQCVQLAYQPYLHQMRAFDRLTGDAPKSTLIATGTGSGKTECFLYPILEYCALNASKPGIKAILIYPMNALSTDQSLRIAKLVADTPALNKLRVGIYIGGKTEKKAWEENSVMTATSVITNRKAMIDAPPDILLTNYKMLDYLLVRPWDSQLWSRNQPTSLKFVVVDELHTFDGAQGTDLACLLRRLKARLGTPKDHLCCIGTSATLGSDSNSDDMRLYASEVFSESFDENAIIREDRKSSAEFLSAFEWTECSRTPLSRDIPEVRNAVMKNDLASLLNVAQGLWFNRTDLDLQSDEGRVELSKRLGGHAVFRTMLRCLETGDMTTSALCEKIRAEHAQFRTWKDDDLVLAIESMLTLVSAARTKQEDGRIAPFLNVRVQFWMREQTNIVSSVVANQPTFMSIGDVPANTEHHWLPIVNCRQCGRTCWASLPTDDDCYELKNHKAFYNEFFKGNERVKLIYPLIGDEHRWEGLKKLKSHRNAPAELHKHLFCPKCMRLRNNAPGTELKCEDCGTELMQVAITNGRLSHKDWSTKRIVCPYCGEEGGLGLLGLRSVTAVSAILSQVFASQFNDDKKVLTFSDSVQDASHRAGFFNSRTWHFGLRTAIAQYAESTGLQQNLSDFLDGFIAHLHRNYPRLEQYVGLFLPPDMAFFREYEAIQHVSADELARDKVLTDDEKKRLYYLIDKRLRFEVLLEFGIKSHTGRTLEHSGNAMISFDPNAIQKAAGRLLERIKEELPELQKASIAHCEQFVMLYLHVMRMNGAIWDSLFDGIGESGSIWGFRKRSKSWLQKQDNAWLMPRFIVIQSAKDTRIRDARDPDSQFDRYDATCYTKPCQMAWTLYERQIHRQGSLTMSVNDETFEHLALHIIQALTEAGIVKEIRSHSDQRAFYGINPEYVRISQEIQKIKCDHCGAQASISAEDSQFMQNAPCLGCHSCTGCMQRDEESQQNYYERLYRTGDGTRINAYEHTGLLSRGRRESIEQAFKKPKSEHRCCDPNVLSCTPTLEMGIDVGDLSTVILCNMPKNPASFIQRIGRAGRRDGNAFSLTVANNSARDLYYYASPEDMINGQIDAPAIFLGASAVLERQFIAFCLDQWVRKHRGDTNIIPRRMSGCTTNPNHKSVFPNSFLHETAEYRDLLLHDFFALFENIQAQENLSENTFEHVREKVSHFARFDEHGSCPMHERIWHAFHEHQADLESLTYKIQKLTERLNELKKEPKDSTIDEKILETRRDIKALETLSRTTRNKDTFGFLSDEGLLPNYAFPEEGAILRAVLLRHRTSAKDEIDKDKETTGKTKKSKDSYQFERLTSEYGRSASAAIREFAPNNDFYVDGHRLRIDQIDLAGSEPTQWRLCPNCSHAQEEAKTDQHHPNCPKCQSSGWSDKGQIRTMLRIHRVMSTTEISKATSGDETEQRKSTFYNQQMHVEVAPENIDTAFEIEGESIQLGYEFAQKATLREINYGESTLEGQQMAIAGKTEARKGFKLCQYCGKILPEQPESKDHAQWCPSLKDNAKQANAVLDGLFLFREFTTEVLRILIPELSDGQTVTSTHSFTSAFMLGLSEYFGNVEHLKATIQNEPLPDSSLRVQYLVIYDEVPGGTGYLRQICNDENVFLDICRCALKRLEQCSCRNNTEENSPVDGINARFVDGCYRCILSHKTTQSTPSRYQAITTLNQILDHQNRIQKISNLCKINTTKLYDSILEERFMASLPKLKTPNRTFELTEIPLHGKTYFNLKIQANQHTFDWEIEPQCDLDFTNSGVKIPSRPDFILRLMQYDGKSCQRGRRPIALFTDGFTYHKDIVGRDALKREAIRRTQQYRVWVLTWDDVMQVYENKTNSDDATTTFVAPAKQLFDKLKLDSGCMTRILTDTQQLPSSFELLARYLSTPLNLDGEDDFESDMATLLTASICSQLNPVHIKNAELQHQLQTDFNDKSSSANFIQAPSNAKYIAHAPKYSNLQILSALIKPSSDGLLSILYLDDAPHDDHDQYLRDWNGFWHAFNAMQFLPHFVATTESAFTNSDNAFGQLQDVCQQRAADDNLITNASSTTKPEIEETAPWANIIYDESLLQKTREFAKILALAGAEPPDDIGAEIEIHGLRDIVNVTFLWNTEPQKLVLSEDYYDADELPEIAEKLRNQNYIVDII